MSLRVEPLAEQVTQAGIKLDDLRQAISREYEAVAKTPQKGFHFHTGRRLTEIVEYKQEWLEGIFLQKD